MCLVLMVLNLSSRDTMKNLYDIAPAFSFVLNKGLVLGSVDYKPDEFGNTFLVMLGVSFSLRFERDRGQVFVDIGSDEVGWYKLEYILEFIDCSVRHQIGEPPDPSVLATVLQVHWEKVMDLFADHQKILTFQVFAKQKSAAFLNKIFHKGCDSN